MANTLRIKRRAAGGAAGAPASLANAELAFNEQDLTLYYGIGTGGAGGTATSAIPIAGNGAFVDKTSAQTIGGAKTFSSIISGSINGNAATAAILQTARNISVSGDISGVASFDGSANSIIAATLATVNANVGTFTKLTVNGKGLVTGASLAILNDIAAPTADYSFANFKLINVADPINPQDAATKIYVDNAIQGLDAKASVRAGTTANIVLSGTQTVDGVVLAVGDRVLVKNQTTASQNGIYVVSATAWTRAVDMDVWLEVPSAFTFIETGTSLGDSSWVCTSDQGGTINTTAITFVQFGNAASYSAGNGLLLTGSTFSVVGTANRISVSAGGVDISAAYAGQATITTLGTVVTGVWNGTTIAVANGGTGVASLTGLVKGNGAAAFSAAVDGTDYLSPNATVDGGTF